MISELNRFISSDDGFELIEPAVPYPVDISNDWSTVKRADASNNMDELSATKLKIEKMKNTFHHNLQVLDRLERELMSNNNSEAYNLALNTLTELSNSFDESKHPRAPKGTEEGGQWTSETVGDVVKYTPNENLTPEESAIEKKFGEYLDKNYDRLKKEYLEKHTNLLSADDAKEFSDDYVNNRGELASAVHEPASGFIKTLFVEMLSDPKVKNSVIFMAGGTGSGKTTGIAGVPRIKNKVAQAGIVYDGNLNGEASALKKINQALRIGNKKVSVLYIYRNPVEAFENGVIPRMKRMGRSVPIEQHISTHEGSYRTVLTLREHFKGNKQVHFDALDNANGKGKAAQISFANLAKKAYFSSTLKAELYESARQKKEAGTITENQYRGLLSKISNRYRVGEYDSRRAVELLRSRCIGELEF